MSLRSSWNSHMSDALRKYLNTRHIYIIIIIHWILDIGSSFIKNTYIYIRTCYRVCTYTLKCVYNVSPKSCAWCVGTIEYAVQYLSIYIHCIYRYIRPIKTSKMMYCFRAFRRAPKMLSDPKTTHHIPRVHAVHRVQKILLHRTPATGITRTHTKTRL